MKAVDPRNKKKEEEEEIRRRRRIRWRNGNTVFYNPSKIMKLVLFILIIDGTSKEHKRMEQKVLNQSLKGLGRF